MQPDAVFQRAWDKLPGKHEFPPAISPAGTLKGPIGGILAAIAAAAALWWITPFAWQQAALIALIRNVPCPASSTAPAIRCARSSKDWGTMTEGRAGTLGRVDPVSFSAPVFSHIVRCW